MEEKEKKEVKKSCDTCKYENYQAYEGCDKCGLNFSEWTPKQVKKPSKDGRQTVSALTKRMAQKSKERRMRILQAILPVYGIDPKAHLHEFIPEYGRKINVDLAMLMADIRNLMEGGEE
jgi:hypothetical protein